MQRLKRTTQSVTGLICFFSFFVWTYVLVYLVQLLHGWQVIDRFYEVNETMFWALFIVSRLFYGYACSIFWVESIEWLARHEFLWFKPQEPCRYQRDEENRDKSGTIVKWFLLIVYGFILSEMMIRVYTWTPPFYFK